MESAIHWFSDLFSQLGLPNHPADIHRFLAEHTPLAHGVSLPDAPFWSSSQASFLREALLQDSDWAELADRLSQSLRGQESPDR